MSSSLKMQINYLNLKLNKSESFRLLHKYLLKDYQLFTFISVAEGFTGKLRRYTGSLKS